MNDEQLLRYSRQIMLPDFDIAGQENLLAARVAILGVGGLGAPVAMYLASAGVGHLTLIDDDHVELANLQRQIIHGESSLGETKVESARNRIEDLNPATILECRFERLDSVVALTELAEGVDLIVDATDNFGSRYALNIACLTTKTPVISGAAIRFNGQITVFDPRRQDSPCYRCLYPNEGGDDDLNCSENGVIAPLVGIIGTMQAMEAIKILSGVGEPLVGKLLFFDARTAQWQQFGLPRNPKCAACGHRSP